MPEPDGVSKVFQVGCDTLRVHAQLLRELARAASDEGKARFILGEDITDGEFVTAANGHLERCAACTALVSSGGAEFINQEITAGPFEW